MTLGEVPFFSLPIGRVVHGIPKIGAARHGWRAEREGGRRIMEGREEERRAGDASVYLLPELLGRSPRRERTRAEGSASQERTSC